MAHQPAQQQTMIDRLPVLDPRNIPEGFVTRAYWRTASSVFMLACSILMLWAVSQGELDNALLRFLRMILQGMWVVLIAMHGERATFWVWVCLWIARNRGKVPRR